MDSNVLGLTRGEFWGHVNVVCRYLHIITYVDITIFSNLVVTEVSHLSIS